MLTADHAMQIITHLLLPSRQAADAAQLRFGYKSGEVRAVFAYEHRPRGDVARGADESAEAGISRGAGATNRPFGRELVDRKCHGCDRSASGRAEVGGAAAIWAAGAVAIAGRSRWHISGALWRAR